MSRGRAPEGESARPGGGGAAVTVGAASVDRLKRAAATRAVALVESGMVLGLGTGSTIEHFLELLGDRVAAGELRDVVGVPTSERTAASAHRLGIPVVELADHPALDLAVDGADEVDPEVNLIKGLGGALLREKMVAQAARRFVVIADEGKAVTRLGTRSPLPVEVVAFGWQAQHRFLEQLGARPELRRTDDAAPYRTDNGNLVLDAHFPDGIADPKALERALQRRAGVVESGLFLGMTERAFLAGEEGVRIVTPGEPAG